MAEGSGGTKIVALVLSILLAALFLFAGAMKLMGTEQTAAAFMKFGYPLFFSYIVGLTEVGGALLLFAPKVARYAAMVLILVMLGAIVSVLRVGDSPLLPIITLVLLGIVAYLRDPAAA